MCFATCSLEAQKTSLFGTLSGGAHTQVPLGLAQGLHLKEALQKGFPKTWCSVKGPTMASSSSKGNTKKPSWADLVDPTSKKPPPEGEAKDEPMDEDEWWVKDWKDGGQSWDEWWQEKEKEWREWKKWEREHLDEEEEAKAWEKEVAMAKEEEEEEEKEWEKPPAKWSWTNRNGSSKEKAKKAWAGHRAKEEGLDEQVCKLGALGMSRVKRLLSRQQDRLTQKETVEAAREAAREANAAVQAAQNLAAWQNHGYQQGYQACQWQAYSEQQAWAQHYMQQQATCNNWYWYQAQGQGCHYVWCSFSKSCSFPIAISHTQVLWQEPK